VSAAGLRDTAVARAGVLVVAVKGAIGYALATFAVVTQGAGVAVAAGAGARSVVTDALRSAEVGGAGVLVIADLSGAGLTGPCGARVSHSAGIAVRAGALDGLMLTAPAWKAEVEGTGVAIVAGEGPVTDAAAQGAMVAGGAEVLVVTWPVVGREHATRQRVASVVSAQIAIVTDQGSGPGFAGAIVAMIA
jgi:hypothetical protein